MILTGWFNQLKEPLRFALRAREEGFKGVIVPMKNAREAAVVADLEVYGIEKLGDVVDFYNGVISRIINPPFLALMSTLLLSVTDIIALLSNSDDSNVKFEKESSYNFLKL